MKCFVLFLFIFSNLAFAQEDTEQSALVGKIQNSKIRITPKKDIFSKNVSVMVDANENFYLVGKNCDVLVDQAEAISKWSKQDSSSKCTCLKKRCQLNVTNTLPNLVKEKNGTCSLQSGPNCWNNSLVSAGILQHLRYTSPKEMHFWMTSPLCRLRGDDEKHEPGDIIAIRNRTDGEVHGFVHLTDDLAYSKNGFYKKRPYNLQSPQNVFKVYKVPKKCETFPDRTKCKLWVDYLKCESMDEYLAKHPIMDEDLKNAFSILDKEECKVADMTLSSSVSGDLVRISKAVLLSIIKLAKEKTRSKDITDEEKFIWKGIVVKAEATIVQTNLLND